MVGGSRTYDTNGTSLSWSIETISPNIRGQKEKAKNRCLVEVLLIQLAITVLLYYYNHLAH
jgi:hypothetical protein